MASLFPIETVHCHQICFQVTVSLREEGVRNPDNKLSHAAIWRFAKYKDTKYQEKPIDGNLHVDNTVLIRAVECI